MQKANGCAELLTAPERWAQCPHGDGMYEVSSHGRVRALRSVSGWSRWKYYTGKVLAQATKSSGYKQVTLRVDGKDKAFLVHRLVLETFSGAPRDGQQACHNDGNKENNSLENLRWDSVKGNAADRARHGTAFKFAHDEERLIAGMNDTVSAVSRRFGIARETVRAIRLRNGWRKDAKGKWVLRVVDVS